MRARSSRREALRLLAAGAVAAGAAAGGAAVGGASGVARAQGGDDQRADDQRADAQRANDRLEIVGNTLYRGGKPYRLLGVAVGDPIYIRAGRTVADYAEIREHWRANTVRIGLHPGHWRAAPARSFELLARDVAAARAEGLYVIVDWHAIGFPDAFEERPDPAWDLPVDAYISDRPMAHAFWREMALGFGRDPGVIFELWNEPVIDGRLWESTGRHWPLVKRLWVDLIETVRRHSDAIVLASGTRWAHDLKGAARDLIDDPRTAYAWHCYPPADRGKPGRWHASLDGIQAVKPVVVTEWGFCGDCPDYIRGSAAEFGRPFVAEVLERYRLGSTAWCWSPGAAPPMLGREPGAVTDFGGFVRDYLRTAWRPA